MTFTGGCYCGAIRYEAEGPVRMRAQCHCRECQYISGGAENLVMVLPAATFKIVKGEPARFKRPDLPDGVTREFCPTCGTHLWTRTSNPKVVILKIGSLDDPSVYGGPDAVYWTAEAQPFHLFPEGVPAFPGFPPRPERT